MTHASQGVLVTDLVTRRPIGTPPLQPHQPRRWRAARPHRRGAARPPARGPKPSQLVPAEARCAAQLRCAEPKARAWTPADHAGGRAAASASGSDWEYKTPGSPGAVGSGPSLCILSTGCPTAVSSTPRAELTKALARTRLVWFRSPQPGRQRQARTHPRRSCRRARSADRPG